MPDGDIVTPDIRDAERLQGFAPDWTAPAALAPGRRASHRWKLVGNAVSTQVFAWLGSRLLRPGDSGCSARDREFDGCGKWPNAAWGRKGKVHVVDRSMWPVRRERPSLEQFLRYPTKPLSAKATAGFLSRTRLSSLRFPPGFLVAVAAHLARVERGLFAKTG
jgi:DNA (cytosine-5)-methyltransferase 1